MDKTVRLPMNNLHGEVKVYFWDILAWIISLGDDATFTTPDIASMFDLTTTDAAVRVRRLRKFGMVKPVNPMLIRSGRSRSNRYMVTPWGKRYLHDRQEREKKEGKLR